MSMATQIRPINRQWRSVEPLGLRRLGDAEGGGNTKATADIDTIDT